METDRNRTPGSPPVGRIGIARERAFTAKLTLFAGAAASFGIAMVLVKASHPAAGTDGSDGATPSGSVASSSIDSFDDLETGSGFSGGDIGTARSAPSFVTRSS